MNCEKKNVSVAMTCYNGSRYVVEQLDSLRLQTRKIDEVCIIDDNSTDNTVKIIQEYIAHHDLTNWKVSSNKENLGWVKNFHKAILETTGDIVFFCDQDDVWHHDKIELMTDILSTSNEISVLACRLNLIDSMGHRLPNMHKSFPFDSNGTRHVLKNCLNSKFLYSISPGCTLAVKRELVSKLYGEERCKLLPHDALFWKIGTCLDCAYIYDDALIDYRIHSNNASNPSATMGTKLKSKDKRLNEVDLFVKDFSNVVALAKFFGVNQIYIKIINDILEHLNTRKKWISQELKKNVILYYLREKKFYRSFRMFLGDLIARNR